MAVDFDFDGTFNDEEANEEIEPEEGADEGDEKPRRRNPLRLILLVLLILVLLCVVCFLASRLLPSGLIPGFGGGEPAVPAPTEEAALPPTEEAPAPVATEEAPAPTTEPTAQAPAPAPTEQPAEQPTVVVQPTQEPTQEPTLVVEPTDELVDEHGEPIAPTATPISVPGPTATPTIPPPPTSTPGPTVVITPGNCANNLPPIADAGGPYNAMRGKGQAFITFDGSGSTDADGVIVNYGWNFGDGSPTQSGETVAHGYTSIGAYVATLTVTDDCGATAQDTAGVTIVGPTPPATGTPTTPTPTATPGGSAQGTIGFCYRVQYGDTLSGLAWRFGVSWQDLAWVNGVPMHYFVIAGQGLFIPTGQITAGPNIYQVEPGDTLNSVAYQCGITINRLAQANGLGQNDALTPGDFIIIPPWQSW
jgi:LysM repeat protein